MSDILENALGTTKLPVYQPATLTGYSHFRVVGASFPAIIKSDGGSVRGACITLDSVAEAQALHAVERMLYDRTEVELQIEGQPFLQKAYTYVWRGSVDELSTEPWDLEDFVRNRRPTARP